MTMPSLKSTFLIVCGFDGRALFASVATLLSERGFAVVHRRERPHHRARRSSSYRRPCRGAATLTRPGWMRLG
jgi:hypothetical protein